MLPRERGTVDEGKNYLTSGGLAERGALPDNAGFAQPACTRVPCKDQFRSPPAARHELPARMAPQAHAEESAPGRRAVAPCHLAARVLARLVARRDGATARARH